MKYKYVLLFSPIFLPEHVADTGIQTYEGHPVLILHALLDSIPQDRQGLTGHPFLRPSLPLLLPVANSELLHKIRKSAQYLERKHLVVNSERMAELSTGQSRILPYMRTPFLLGWRIAERETVSERLGVAIRRDGRPCWWRNFRRAPRLVSFRPG